MKVLDLLQNDSFEFVVKGDLEREIKGWYTGDLLSWVLSHAKEDEAWCTVLTHINIVAIASLVQLSCIIVVDDALIDEETMAKAQEENITLIKTRLTTVEVVQKLLCHG